MVKITFEVDENFIIERGAPENIVNVGGNDAKTSVAKAMFRMVAVMGLLGDIEKGKKEFVISKDELRDADKKVFDSCFDEVCLLAHVCARVDSATEQVKDETDDK